MVDDLASALADALASGRELDLGGASLPAAMLAAALTAEPPPGAPALRLKKANVTGALRLAGARVQVPVELRQCRFAHAPDLRMAELAGLALTGCSVPALRAGNLRVAADLLLNDGFTVNATVNLTDAQVGGSLRLSGARLRGVGGSALIADRIVVEGTFYARKLHSGGELRLPGGRITGNIDLAGADLSSPITRDVLDATGITIGGSLLAGRHDEPNVTFSANGRVLLAGARVGGDMSLSGARIESTGDPEQPGPEAESRMPGVPGGIVDDSACLVADRIHVDGNLELDDGLETTGTLRLPNAVVGGYLRLSGAKLTGPFGASDRGIALLGDGLAVGGDLEGRDHGGGALTCNGQLRLVGAQVHGSASLSGIELNAPDGYALLADRLQIGGEFYLRRARCEGTLRLQNASVGATLDCSGAELARPRLRPDRTVRPSLDLRAATIGKDLLCVGGFIATGGVRVRRTEAGKSAQFVDATLGGPPEQGFVRYALNAYGLSTAELVIRLTTPPQGQVRLGQAQVGSFTDSAAVWQAVGGVGINGFDYQSLNDGSVADAGVRLRWLENVMPDYAPGPYERLATAYRRAGHEELAELVLMERQRRRYGEAGLAGRIWGAMQRWTVGYGYRPWLAVGWLMLFWGLGGAWFSFNELLPVDSGQSPVWNPWLFAADTLLPIVNLGQDGYWRLDGASQWIASGLIAAGWILATTAAAGAARILKRV